ncbi:VWA domain-containing protein [Microtetraspora sp. NBRC 13810]|nr:VWA domain-containing protein [Microtetraspora sp. NBRC 13810]
MGANALINLATDRGGIYLLPCLVFAVVLHIVNAFLAKKIEPIVQVTSPVALTSRLTKTLWQWWKGRLPKDGRTFLSLGATMLATNLVALTIFTGVIEVLHRNRPPCAGTAVKIRIAASQEKDGVLSQVAGKYSGRQVGDDICGQVEIVSVNSGIAMKALADGWNEQERGPRPHVWSPASSVWITLLEQYESAVDQADPVPDYDHPSIVTTPLVIAVLESVAQKRGWLDRPIGWADLATLTTSSQEAFKLGKTNPNYSTSGLNATIGAYYAATGKASDLTVTDVQQPDVQGFVKNVERSIVHYGDISLTFLENLQRADQRGEANDYISAVTVEENSVIDYNRGNPTGDPATLGKQPPPRDKLIAFYPKEGTLYSDHPYIRLDHWMTASEKAVADDFLRYLHSPAVQAEFQSYGYRDHLGRPGPAVPPRGASTAIRTLNTPAPEVIDAILESWSRLRKPANVLMVIDKSGSMNTLTRGPAKTRLALAKEAALAALPEFRPDDRLGLWVFSTRQDGDLDYVETVPPGPMSEVGGRLRKAIAEITVQGGTGLYDTVAAAFDRMRAARDPDAINAIVFLTDGKNEKEEVGLDLPHLLRILDKPSEDSIRVFTIGYGEEADQKVLKQIADLTEGHAYDSRDPHLIDEVFTSVISNF